MIFWRQYLAMLREDGVARGEAEEEALDDDGSRIVAQFLTREVNGRLLHYELPVPIVMDEPVPRYIQRQVVNTLRLPVTKYIF